MKILMTGMPFITARTSTSAERIHYWKCKLASSAMRFTHQRA
jgi:hypothetical protein